MLSYLKELVQKGEYEKALQLALEALIRADNSLEDMIGINLVIAECRIRSGHPLEAIPSAQLAAKLARDLGYFDLLAEANHWMGDAYARTRQYQEAIAACFEVIELAPKLISAAHFVLFSWYNLGLIYERLGDAKQQVWALNNAWRLRHVAHSDAWRNSLRTMLIHAHLSNKDFGAAKALIKEWKEHLEAHPDDDYVRYLYVIDSARLAVERRKFRLAVQLALVGLEMSKGKPARQWAFCKYLYQASLGLGRYEDALGYALTARLVAIESRRYDVEYEAAEWVVDLIRSHGQGLLTRLDSKYLSLGIDLSTMLGHQAWLPRHHN